MAAPWHWPHGAATAWAGSCALPVVASDNIRVVILAVFPGITLLALRLLY